MSSLTLAEQRIEELKELAAQSRSDSITGAMRPSDEVIADMSPVIASFFYELSKENERSQNKMLTISIITLLVSAIALGTTLLQAMHLIK